MRILFAQRDRWERSIGGSEFYEHHLVRELAAHHEIRTFCTNPSSGAPPWAIDGAMVEVAPNRDLYPGAAPEQAVRRAFAQLVEEFAPDVVHIHDLYRLSTALPGIAARRGIPVVHTLHDYFLLCPRLVLRDTAGRLCPGPSVLGCLRCGRDMARERYRLKLAGEPMLGRWKRRLKTLARRRLTEGYFALLRRRRLAAAVGDIDLLLCPSRFLRERLRTAGLPAAKLRTIGYGLPHLGTPRPKRPGARLRIVFIGQLLAHKGVPVLLEAARRAPEVDLVLYGPLAATDIADTIRHQAAAAPNVRLGGILRDADKAEVYAAADVLVAPSIWYENQPFTILEAFHFHTPVLTCRLGGMTELVAGGGGWLVPPEDPAALADCMRHLAGNREEVAAAARTIPAVESMEHHARAIEAIYAEVRA